ncbi:MAG: hypothetical protein AB7I19_11365 [Planctomycetota bacterium]
MLAKDAKVQFEEALHASGADLQSLTPRLAFERMTLFFREARAEDCDSALHGDMLLYQWGTYDWGQGERFEFDVTRQLIPVGGEDDDIWQLRLTIRFDPEACLLGLSAGERWCHSVDDLAEFVSHVHSTEPFLSVADRSDGIVTLDYELVG